ncbi:PD-(D/E)XK nuclease family protein [Candidatus Neoehrlichia procyonis]|uniref:PD-(D/E)XK nuclease superfamily protein n=1 Tax=Candidatus Neoehrlichia procyonis str. RAC413 TaxID=1359163 RepID=A0A0F3NKW8_9RICK|nr:PD-(D/E)XK nuclease family protein [Candidatus Neoehrlichia lotoris]KJV68670.1 PD-(D/E)XK nuclease superfamily protein [Candidatus Neoehrlichia lotoris str. RAC413]
MVNSQVFTVHCSESFLDVVAHHILTQHNAIIIVPDEYDVEFITAVLLKLNYDMSNTIIMSFAEIQNKLIMLYGSTIDPMRKLLLLMQFIELWNKENNDNYSVSLSNELLSLLNEMQVNCVRLESLKDLFAIESSEYWQKASKFLCYLAHKLELECSVDVDFVSSINFYISELICQWKNRDSNCKVILAGVDCSKLFLYFICAIRTLIDNDIILPYVNLDISEENWQVLDKKHYQYIIKNVIDELKIARKDIKQLGHRNDNIIIEKLFNYNMAFYELNYNHSTSSSNIELITCVSEEEEAYIVYDLIKLHENAQIFVSNDSLTRRISSILNIDNIQVGNNNGYLIPMFLLYVVDAVLFNNSLSLLSLLKHPFVRLGYTVDKYNMFLEEFELQVVRQNMDVNFDNMGKVCDFLSPFCSKITVALLPLVTVSNQSLDNILAAHMLCVRCLVSENKGCAIAMIEEFFVYFKSVLKDIKIYSLERYREVLKLILGNYFSCDIFNKLSNVNMVSEKIVILAGFNEGEYCYNYSTFLNASMRRKLGLLSTDEQDGYFNYILYSILYTKKVYITRSVRSFGKVTEEPLLIKYLKILLKEYDCYINDNKKHCDTFCSIKTESCNNSIYNPNLEVRLKTFNVITSTSIDDLIHNPYVFYVRNILNIIPIREINVQLSSKDFGTVVHVIFQKYLSQVGIDSNYNLLLKIAECEFASLYRNCIYVESIWWPKFKKIADHFFNIDIKRKSKIKFIEVEKKFFWNINSNISIVAKCDRVEYLKDGRIAIVDYKTGSIPLQVDIQHGFAPQVIIQALSVMHSTNKQISNLAYWKIDAEQMLIVPIKNFYSIMNSTAENLNKFLNSYLHDEIPFFPAISNSNLSRYKDYELLMRRCNIKLR